MTMQTKKLASRFALAALVAAVFALVLTSNFSAALAGNAKKASIETQIVASFTSDGTITIPAATIKNDTDKILTITDVSIDSDFDFVADWTSDAKGQAAAPGESITVAWNSHTTIPADKVDEWTKSGEKVLVGTITYELTYKDTLPLPDATVEGTYTYSGEAIVPTISGLEDLTEGTDYTLSYKNNINAGEASVTITGKGNYSGHTQEFTFTIAPLDITGISLELSQDEFSYAGAEIQIQVAATSASGEALVEGTDYTVNGTAAAKTCGTYSLSITGMGNYTGTSQEATWTIVPKTLEVSWGEDTFVYDGEVHYPVPMITGVYVGDTVNWNLEGTQIDAGSYSATLSISGNDNYQLRGEDTTKSFTIEQATPEAPTGLTTTAIANQTLAQVALPELPAGYSGTLVWKDPSASTGTSKGTLTATAIYTPTDINYKSVEVSVEVTVDEIGSYWLATADATNPEDESVIVKTQSQIDEDIAVLHGTKAATSAGKDSAAVSAEYTNYMIGLSADGTTNQEVRLYTAWNGSDAGDGANRWVEFRIIQVGQHDGDGSAVTFMATHSLPTAQKMNDVSLSKSGWSGSVMRATMNDSSGYVMSGLSDLVSAVKPIQKLQATYDSDTDTWNEASLSPTIDTFWLISYSELAGEDTSPITEWGHFKNEGSQYAWCTTYVTAPAEVNPAIAGMDETREGDSPSGCSDTYWWERSPYVFVYNCYFASVTNDGYPPNYHSPANNLYGVVPCFAM